jgi:hypothetical protein
MKKIAIVSGLPRSVSMMMMMKLLEADELEAVKDEIWASDNYIREGYYVSE